MYWYGIIAACLLLIGACETKKCDGIDVTLLADPGALSSKAAGAGQEYELFAQSINQAISQTTVDLPGALKENLQKAQKEALGLKDAVVAMGAVNPANIDEVSLVLNQALSITKVSNNPQIKDVANELRKGALKLKSLQPALVEPALKESLEVLDKTYLQGMCGFAKTYSLERIAYYRDDHLSLVQDAMEDFYQNEALKGENPNFAAVSKLNNLYVLLGEIAQIPYPDLSAVSNLLGLTRAFVHEYDELKLLPAVSSNLVFKSLENFYNETKDLSEVLSEFTGILDYCALKKQASLSSLGIDENVSMEEKSPLYAKAKNSSSLKGLSFRVNNAHDVGLLTKFLEIAGLRNVKYFNFQKIMTASKDLNLTEADLILWMVHLLESAQKNSSSNLLVILEDIEALGIGPNDGVEGARLAQKRLREILLKINNNGPVVMVPISEAMAKSWQHLENIEYFQSSKLGLALAKSIIDTLNTLLANDPEESFSNTKAVMQVASAIKSFHDEKFSMGALYGIWKSYLAQKSTGEDSEKIVKNLLFKLGVVPNESSSKRVLALTWDKVAHELKKNPQAFLKSSMLENTQDILSKSADFLVQARLSNVTIQGEQALKAKQQEAENAITQEGNQQVARLNAAGQNQETSIDNAFNDAVTQMTQTKNVSITSLQEQENVSKIAVAQVGAEQKTQVEASGKEQRTDIARAALAGSNRIDTKTADVVAGLEQKGAEQKNQMEELGQAQVQKIATAVNAGIASIADKKNEIVASAQIEAQKGLDDLRTEKAQIEAKAQEQLSMLNDQQANLVAQFNSRKTQLEKLGEEGLENLRKAVVEQQKDLDAQKAQIQEDTQEQLANLRKEGGEILAALDAGKNSTQEEVQKSLDDLRAEKAKQLADVDAKKAQIEAKAQEQLSMLNDQQANLVAQFNSQKTQLEKLGEEGLENLRKAVVEQQKDLDDVRKKTGEFLGDLGNKGEELKRLHQERLVELNNAQEQFKKSIDDKQAEMNASYQQIQENIEANKLLAENEKQQLNEAIIEAQAQSQKMADESKNFFDNAREKLDTLTNLSQTMEQKATDFNNLSEQIQKAQEELENQLQENTNQNEETKRSIAETKDSLIPLQENIEKLVEDLVAAQNDVNQQLKEQEDKFTEAKTQLEDKVTEVTNQVNEGIAKINQELEEATQKQNNSLAQLTTKMAEVENDHERMARNTNQISDKINSLITDVTRAEESLRNITVNMTPIRQLEAKLDGIVKDLEGVTAGSIGKIKLDVANLKAFSENIGPKIPDINTNYDYIRKLIKAVNMLRLKYNDDMSKGFLGTKKSESPHIPAIELKETRQF